VHWAIRSAVGAVGAWQCTGCSSLRCVLVACRNYQTRGFSASFKRLEPCGRIYFRYRLFRIHLAVAAWPFNRSAESLQRFSTLPAIWLHFWYASTASL